MLQRLLCVLFLVVAGDAGADEIGSTPKRVASADAGVTEIIVELGSIDRLVAVDAASAAEAVANLPRLGYHRQLAAEGVMSLNPDLVIGSEQMGPQAVLDTLRRSGVDVLVLPYPGDLDTLRSNVVEVAAIIGSDRSDAVLAALDSQARRLASTNLQGQTAALVLRGEGGTLRMAGAGTGGGGFVDLVGADNVADYRGYRAITAEGLLELKPDVLLLADTEGRGVDDFLERYPVMRFSAPVQEGRLYTVDTTTLVAGVSLAAVLEAKRVLTAASQMSADSGQ